MGSLMYKRIQSLNILDKDKLSKVTGMLIDEQILKISKMIQILTNDDSLNEKVQEALEIIEEDEEQTL